MNGETSGQDRQFPQQEFDALGLVHALVVEARDRGGEELRDGALVYVGVLSQIDRRQAEAEHVDPPAAAPSSDPRARIAPPWVLSDWATAPRSAASSSTLA